MLSLSYVLCILAEIMLNYLYTSRLKLTLKELKTFLFFGLCLMMYTDVMFRIRKEWTWTFPLYSALSWWAFYFPKHGILKSLIIPCLLLAVMEQSIKIWSKHARGSILLSWYALVYWLCLNACFQSSASIKFYILSPLF